MSIKRECPPVVTRLYRIVCDCNQLYCEGLTRFRPVGTRGRTAFIISTLGRVAQQDARAIEPLPVLFPEETGIGPSLIQQDVELRAHCLFSREFLVGYR